MSHMLFATAAVLAFADAFAWGPGHDTTVRCILEKMPAEWRERFKPEWMKDYIRASHLPDRGTADMLLEEDVAWFKKTIGMKDVRDTYIFHENWNLPALLSRLVRAVRTGDDRSVFMYLAIMSHTIVDPAACNHDPIVHVFTYMWGKDALNVFPETDRKLPVDFVFAEHDADTKAVLSRRLAALEIRPLQVSSREKFCEDMMRWDAEAVEVCSAASQRIIENGVEWMMGGDAGAKRRSADALCDIGLWGVERTLQLFETARSIAESGEFEVTPELIAKCKEWSKADAALIASRPMENDTFARPYFPEAGRPVRFAVMYDPTAHMHKSVFAPGGRPLGCQVVGSLKKIRPGLNAGLFDARRFAREGLDPAATPYAMVFRNVWPYCGFDAKAFLAKLEEYKKVGGTVIWVDGRPPAFVLGAAATDAMSDGGMKDGYCKPAYPAPLGEMLSCSLAWTGPGGEKEWRYRRAPSGHAGWYWHGSPWRFDAAKLPPEARAIIEFRAPGRTFTTGIAVPGAVYIPFNAIFPYCLTDETPSFEPFRLSLDSAGETVMRRIIDGACKDRKGLRR